MRSFEPVIPDGMQDSYDAYQFAPAVRSGNWLILSGRIRYDSNGRIPSAIAEQIACTIDSIGTVLQEVGLNYEHIVSITSYHVGDIKAHFKAFIETKARYIRGVHPAWTAVEVAALVRPEALVEITSMARFPGGA